MGKINMKKIIFLIFVLSLLVLSGCGSPTGDVVRDTSLGGNFENTLEKELSVVNTDELTFFTNLDIIKKGNSIEMKFIIPDEGISKFMLSMLALGTSIRTYDTVPNFEELNIIYLDNNNNKQIGVIIIPKKAIEDVVKYANDNQGEDLTKNPYLEAFWSISSVMYDNSVPELIPTSTANEMFGDFAVGNEDYDIPNPYTVYNSYVIYEIEDDKSLKYKVEVYANEGVKYIYTFKNHPENLLDLNYENNLRNILYENQEGDIKKSKIYFSYNPEMEGVEILSAGTLVQILGTGDTGIFKIPVVVSVTEDDSSEDFPIINCDDATKEVGVIELRYGEPEIYFEGECVVLQGISKDDFINNADLLSYIILGVIE